MGTKGDLTAAQRAAGDIQRYDYMLIETDGTGMRGWVLRPTENGKYVLFSDAKLLATDAYRAGLARGREIHRERKTKAKRGKAADICICGEVIGTSACDEKHDSSQ